MWHASAPAAPASPGVAAAWRSEGEPEMGGSGRRRRRFEPTDEGEQIELLCGWPEQRDYKLIRPLVLFGASAAESGISVEWIPLRSSNRPPHVAPRCPHALHLVVLVVL
jgi:hypothetical protein